jgi:hypothetical protein
MFDPWYYILSNGLGIVVSYDGIESQQCSQLHTLDVHSQLLEVAVVENDLLFYLFDEVLKD